MYGDWYPLASRRRGLLLSASAVGGLVALLEDVPQKRNKIDNSSSREEQKSFPLLTRRKNGQIRAGPLATSNSLFAALMHTVTSDATMIGTLTLEHSIS